MKHEDLQQGFSGNEIKQRDGGKSGKLDYVEFGDVARRMLSACGEDGYGWQVLSLDTFVNGKNEVCWLCRGVITIPGLGSREGVGTHPNYDVESPKAAETDAFKRAAVKFGVALDLYDRDKAYRQGQPTPQNGYQQAQSANGQSEGRVSTATAVARQMESNGQQYPGAEGVWHGPGQCPRCYAPAGKRHGKACL